MSRLAIPSHALLRSRQPATASTRNLITSSTRSAHSRRTFIAAAVPASHSPYGPPRRLYCGRNPALWKTARSSRIDSAAKTSVGSKRGLASMAAETDVQAAAVANQTGITTESLRATLESKMQAEKVFVEDISGGCGQSFEAVIVSAVFEKKGTLARHRLVNTALKEEIAAIHAWTPKCFTPGEWKAREKGGA